MTKKRGFLLLLCVVLVFAFAISGCGTDDPVETDDPADDDPDEDEPRVSVNWIANSVWPPSNHQTIALEEYASRVKDATGGNVVIDVQSGGALGYQGPELLQVVRDGLVPVSAIMASGAAGAEPLLNVTTLPFIVQDYTEARLFIDIGFPYFYENLETKWNQKLLLVSPWPGAGLWTQNPIESVDDMVGLKTRTYDTNGALVIEAGGGTPYPLPFSEVYSSLATGVIDSVITSTPTAVDAKFWEVLDYYTPMFLTLGMEFFTVNLDEFNKLDQASQEDMIRIAQEMQDELWEAIVGIDSGMEQITNENGITTVQPTQEFMDDLVEMSADIRNEWLATAPEEAREIVDEFNSKVGR